MDDYFNGSSDDECYDQVYDDDYEDDDFQEPENENRSDGPSCKVIRKEYLLAAQKEDLQKVMDLLSLKEHHARTLLIRHRWDADTVLSVSVERGKEWLYAEAGLLLEGSKNQSSCRSLDEVTCQICFDEVSATESTAMNCGHCFCNNCWAEHFIVKINEGQSRRITCMAYKCYAICDEEKIRNIVGARDPDLAEKFNRFLLESYIEDNKRVKWCPSVPHCGNAIRVEDDEYCEVECACGLQFCFSCSSEAHSPCSCLMWKLWEKKCQDESETVNWITVNTKYCPKCHKPVEKNGGCNLVYCVCGQPFCWLCGGATGSRHTWESIDGHTCGRFKEDELEKTERARKELWRYSHYFNRFKAHTDSLKLEGNLKEKLQAKKAVLEEKQLDSRDFSWVMNGFYRLFRSRQILSYSYPFAYYMFGSELFSDELSQEERELKQTLFEDQQQQFETNIERLSLFLEEPFADYTEERVGETRMKVMDLTKVTNNLCRTIHRSNDPTADIVLALQVGKIKSWHMRFIKIENVKLQGLNKRYSCIDDLLASLQQTTHSIAPYRSEGVKKALEL